MHPTSEGEPQTFDFLGFTHYCDRTRKGWFTVGRKTSAKRRRAKLRALKEVLRRRMHASIGEVGAWLGGSWTQQYFCVPRNSAALASFRFALVRLWHKTLCRRSQRATVTWDRIQCIADRRIPIPCIVHPYPQQRLRLVTTQGRSPVRQFRTLGSVQGITEKRDSYSDRPKWVYAERCRLRTHVFIVT